MNNKKKKKKEKRHTIDGLPFVDPLTVYVSVFVLDCQEKLIYWNRLR